MRFLALAALLLLAGCASAPGPTAPAGDTGSSTTQALHLNATRTVLLRSAHYLNDTGSVGVVAGGCVFVPAPTCQFPDSPVPGKSEFQMALDPGTVAALDATLTWTSDTPATATLGFGAMVMNACDGCNETFLGEVTGPSPLHLALDKLTATLSEGQILHLYVWNAGGAVANPSVPGFAYATPDQAFAIAAKATVERQAKATVVPA